MFNWSLFNDNSKKETFSESLMNSLCEDLSKLAEGAVPDLKEQVQGYLLESKKGFVDGLKEIIEENKENFSEEQAKAVKEQTKALLTSLKSKFLGFLDVKGCTNPQLVHDINSTIDCQHKIIAMTCDITQENLKNYQKKIERANTYLTLVSGKSKKTIKILIIGATQKGKTSLACLISKINKKELDGARINGFGLESDTTTIKEYKLTRNGVDLIWIDTPGWWDSRGEKQDSANKALIEQYIEKNKDIDVIMFVAKLGDTLDKNLQQSIADFGQKCGSKIWNKCLLVLTYAQSVASPHEYMEMAQEELYPDEEESLFNDMSKMTKIKILAWEKFTQASSETWQKYFSKRRDSQNESASSSSSTSSSATSSSSASSDDATTKKIPVCLVESSPYQLPLDKNIPQYILYDGTPFLEELMYQILLLVEKDKSPIAFLAMASETKKEKSSDSASSSSDSTSSSKSKSDSQHDKSLNNAADKALSKPKEEGGWGCLLL
eukprot:Pompholyxophrys_sp_v1_NODE_1_length_32789_cov_6.460653.p4 type:complete len:493 gc:universal NODE_1_length_32789_cov_6.460653:10026-8548(-)